MNIVVLDGYTLNPGDLDWSGLKVLGELTIYDRTGDDRALIIDRAMNAQAVLTNKTPLDAKTIAALPGLRYIGVLATGYNVVDLDAATQHGIPVTNIPSYGTDSVAQMAFSHLLNFCQPVVSHSEDVKNGNWSKSIDFCFWNTPLIELKGKTMGIIGFGRIGRRLGEIANAFGMKVIAHDIYHGNEPDWPDFTWGEAAQVFTEADVVSLHCPLTPENTGMINKKTLGLMKNTAFLINMSRGPLVRDADLAEALKNGIIAGAGIDVLGQEPPEADNPLFETPNISITPHIAWATREARSRLLDTAVGNLRAFAADSVTNRVNRA